ncbi:hypothetical protein [Legionella micdadei]|uniref:Secreted protein n=1 Tax=Legionella micdadei TaxID=451 RepID=A0A098GI91_LEGMI|nr:hypothetical protein [Legionella micdadei]ARG96893.1 hypothetical protein B6N58_03985 [Legionella micdadei]ARG99626.1 hypothetical protein B6V88_03900 [Legionella micdadei]KTD26576.1 hypothetical protein Lmic_2670 [Legionella micdadei]NSL17833.1 hypothetical protein [Legionella micdadei]CEG61705.1 conserved exported protein of unknown function [Legionella micdadei]
MKFKTLLLAGCLSVFSSAYADHSHTYPQTSKEAAAKSAAKKGAAYPEDYCTIEIYNNSYDGVWVYGTFDDGTRMESFYIPPRDIPHYIHLDYYDSRYGYVFCHPGMYITIEDYRGRTLYSRWTTPGTPLEVRPYFNNQLQVETKKK